MKKLKNYVNTCNKASDIHNWQKLAFLSIERGRIQENFFGDLKPNKKNFYFMYNSASIHFEKIFVFNKQQKGAKIFNIIYIIQNRPINVCMAIRKILATKKGDRVHPLKEYIHLFNFWKFPKHNNWSQKKMITVTSLNWKVRLNLHRKIFSILTIQFF